MSDPVTAGPKAPAVRSAPPAAGRPSDAQLRNALQACAYLDLNALPNGFAHDQIHLLQEKLVKAGAQLDVTGTLDDDTRQAVLDFQQQQQTEEPGFLVDAKVGQQTWARLLGIAGPVKPGQTLIAHSVSSGGAPARRAPDTFTARPAAPPPPSPPPPPPAAAKPAAPKPAAPKPAAPKPAAANVAVDQALQLAQTTLQKSINVPGAAGKILQWVQDPQGAVPSFDPQDRAALAPQLRNAALALATQSEKMKALAHDDTQQTRVLDQISARVGSLVLPLALDGQLKVGFLEMALGKSPPADLPALRDARQKVQALIAQKDVDPATMKAWSAGVFTDPAKFKTWLSGAVVGGLTDSITDHVLQLPAVPAFLTSAAPDKSLVPSLLEIVSGNAPKTPPPLAKVQATWVKLGTLAADPALKISAADFADLQQGVRSGLETYVANEGFNAVLAQWAQQHPADAPLVTALVTLLRTQQGGLPPGVQPAQLRGLAAGLKAAAARGTLPDGTRLEGAPLKDLQGMVAGLGQQLEVAAAQLDAPAAK
jgi:hypothetical protein